MYNDILGMDISSPICKASSTVQLSNSTYYTLISFGSSYDKWETRLTALNCSAARGQGYQLHGTLSTAINGDQQAIYIDGVYQLPSTGGVRW